ncbi:hypothetical protein Tco_1573023, partial [Tanacetum coccineum]
MSSQEQPSQVPITEPITVSFTTSHPTHTPSPMPHDSPLLGGHTPGSDEGSKKLNELTELCTKLSNKVTSLEDDLKQTKNLYGKALTKLVKKVKQLETKLKSTTERRKAMMVIFDDEDDLVSEDTSKQGRMTETKYEEVEIDLNQTKILADASRERVKTYTRRRSTDSSRDSTVGGLFSTAEEVQEKLGWNMDDAFQVTADAPEIYMQEFWASAYVHNRSVRFKMNNKKHIIGLEQFRDILQICPRIGNKKFVEPPLEKEILIFLPSLGHSGD